MGRPSLLPWGGASTKELAIHRYRRAKATWATTSPGAPSEIKQPSTFSIMSIQIDTIPKKEQHDYDILADEIVNRIRQSTKGLLLPIRVVLLQRVNRRLYTLLLAHKFIKDGFMVVPATRKRDWPRGAWYANVTLLSRETYFSQVVRLLFHNSAVARHAIVLDLLLTPSSSSSGEITKPRCVRVINTELEPPAFGKKTREDQEQLLRGCMKDGGVYASVMLCNPDEAADKNMVERDKARSGTICSGGKSVQLTGGIKLKHGTDSKIKMTSMEAERDGMYVLEVT